MTPSPLRCGHRIWRLPDLTDMKTNRGRNDRSSSSALGEGEEGRCIMRACQTFPGAPQAQWTFAQISPAKLTHPSCPSPPPSVWAFVTASKGGKPAQQIAATGCGDRPAWPCLTVHATVSARSVCRSPCHSLTAAVARRVTFSAAGESSIGAAVIRGFCLEKVPWYSGAALFVPRTCLIFGLLRLQIRNHNKREGGFELSY